MQLVYFGSGVFGLPTLERLARDHQVRLVVSQPDRPAGRSRHPVPTPISSFATSAGLPVLRPERMDAPGVVEAIRAVDADAFVVIAYGHKLPAALLDDRFAINLHASLLPKYRGAAPINWAMINGESETGVSVITLAERMDAGLVLARRRLAIDARETAGELHDRLAELGPEIVQEVLSAQQTGTLRGVAQDPAEVSWAPRLKKADGTVDFDRPAVAVRQRIHGLTPW
ncbi:MAG: methionyl-tRNA formyltransferase, partial [Phycisphaerae bacterium]|nr:methionyl-tRNA formyltransferase [Phycisphaerae bacterium]